MQQHVPSEMTILILILAIVPLSSTSEENPAWRRMTGLLLDSCFRPHTANAAPEKLMALLRTCLARRSLTALRRAADSDVIGISEGIELVRYAAAGNRTSSNRYPKSVPFDEGVDWQTNFVQGVDELLRTHVLKIQLKTFDRVLEEARGRRKNMFNQMLMFGVIVASLIVIPMGFQFLAILGGKALLLSKMALILASIQGLKKIATSNFNYGLYSYAPGGPGPCKEGVEGGCGDYPRDDRGDRDVYFSVDIEGLDGEDVVQYDEEDDT